jgi:hypothetical protein
MRKIIYLLSIFSAPVFATQTYICDFTNYSDQKGNKKEDFQLTFVIDNEADKAYQIGNIGSDPVIHINKGHGMSFIEITGMGNVMTTTIDTKMKAVHSRNTVGVSGELIPSQYYGHCEKK